MNANAPISFEATLKARYAAARGRIFAAGIRAKANDKEPSRPFSNDVPLWVEHKVHFDAHVFAFLAYKQKRSSPLIAFMIQRARHYGFTFGELIATTKQRRVVYAKHMVMLEAKEEFPDVPLTRIGEVMGDLDHSTVCNGIHLAEQYRAGMAKIPPIPMKRKRVRSKLPKPFQPPYNRTSEETEAEVVKLWTSGEQNKREISRLTGVSDRSVLNILKRRGIVE